MKNSRSNGSQFNAVATVVALMLLAAACSDATAYSYVAPANVEAISDGLSQVVLTEEAATRTGLTTAVVVREDVGGVDRLIIPYSAVMYHYDGTTWTYTNPEGLTFIRAAVDIESVDGDRAILTSGPEPGTKVVSVGAAELYGAEFGVGK